jgi:hypothetical protein
MQKIMARLAELLDEDQFANIESIVKGVGVEPPEQRAAPIGKVLSDAEMFDAKMDGKSGNVIWFNAPKPGFIYAAPAEQRAARNGEDGYVCPAGKAQAQAEQRAANKGGNDD